MANIEKLEQLFEEVKTNLAEFNQSPVYKKSVAVRKSLQAIKVEAQHLRVTIKDEVKKTPAA